MPETRRRCALTPSAGTMAILLGVVLATGCRDNDPLSPMVPRRMPPKLNRTLSGGFAVSSPTDINTAGEVVGAVPVGAAYHAAISLNGAAYDLGTIDQSAGTSTHATAISSRGEVVGWETVADGTTYGFLWIPDAPNGTTGKMQRLPDSQSGPAQAMGINDAGEIAGNSVNGTALVLWTERGAAVTEIPTPYSGTMLSGGYINAYGQIATAVQDGDGVYHAYVWTPAIPNGTEGQFTGLDGGPSDYGWVVAALNDAGQVVVNPFWGYGPVLWTPSTTNGNAFTSTALDALWATDMNSRGDVLTTSYGPNSEVCGVTYHVYLWRPATPNGSTAPPSIDVTPDVGLDYWGECLVYAYSGIVSEEESGAIEAFGTLSDWNGNTSDEMWTATDLNVPRPLKPTITWSGYAYEGSDAYFDGSATRPYSSGLQYQWDFGDGSTGAGISVLHHFPDNGSYTVRLTVTDATGSSASATVTVVVNNIAPTATFSASPTTVNEGGSYSLSVGNISDVAADLASVSVALDCGDGRGYQAVASTASLTCTAPNEAARVARAQVVDKDGGSSEYSVAVTVLDVAPTVTILNAPASIASQTDYTLSFKFSDPGPLDQWSYSIDWGDGTATSTTNVATQGTTITSSHRFNVSRKGGVKSVTYFVNVTVRDNGGAAGNVTVPVQVTAVPGHP